MEYLKQWIDDGADELIEKYYSDDLNYNISSSKDIEIYIEAINEIKFSLMFNDFNNVNENLFHLILQIQDITEDNIFKMVQKCAIAPWIEIYELISENYGLIVDTEDLDIDLLILEIFALYDDEIGINIIANKILEGYKSDNYIWTIIFEVIGYDISKSQVFIEKLNHAKPNDIPEGFLRGSYLDFANCLSLEMEKLGICPESHDSYNLPEKHLFNNPEGMEILSNYLSSDNIQEFSHAVASTVAIPFLDDTLERGKLLDLANEHPFIEVSLESAWAGSKLGYNSSINKLVDFASDYHYAHKAVEYLNELGLDDLIPDITHEGEFNALSEMSDWLRHPNEFGAYPDEAEVIDSRVLFWPPTGDQREMFVVKYKFEFWNADGTSEYGLGLVGSETFSLFEIGSINKTPNEIYAIHCAWELDLDNYEDSDVGFAILREHNDI